MGRKESNKAYKTKFLKVRVFENLNFCPCIYFQCYLPTNTLYYLFPGLSPCQFRQKTANNGTKAAGIFQFYRAVLRL